MMLKFQKEPNKYRGKMSEKCLLGKGHSECTESSCSCACHCNRGTDKDKGYCRQQVHAGECLHFPISPFGTYL